MDNWVLQPVLSPLLIAVALAILIGMLFLTPPREGLSPPRRRWLRRIRLAVIALAALAMVRPGCVQQVSKNQSAVLLMLLDTTRSMELPHVRDDSTRWNALLETIEANRPLLDQLEENQIEVRWFGFDNQVTGLGNEEGDGALPEIPSGAETDIGSAIYRTSQEVRNERLVGVVLMSDGVQNAIDPEIELNRATDTLNDMEVPLYAVPFGLAGDSGQVADVAIQNLDEQYRVAVKNRLSVRATVATRGFVNQPIRVRMFLSDREGNETPAGPPVTIQPTQPVEEIPVQLDYVPPEVGEFQLIVRAEPQPGEVALRNNELPSFLTVSEGGMRVLYLEGNLGWEQKELKEALTSAAQGIDVEMITIFPNTRGQWPIGPPLTEKLKDPTVDVIIIGDLDSRALYDPATQTENMEALVEAVTNGKGLLMLGGYHAFGPGLYQRTPLADLLPIQMDPSERQDFGQDVRRDLHIDRRIGLQPTREHYVTRLPGEQGNRAIWAELPKLLGANKFYGLKPNAIVLLETDDTAQSPILVAGNVGGRILCFAGDSTWRWKWQGFETQYNAFWRQALFWLAFWDGRDDDSVWINLPQRRYQPRSVVRFTVGARTLVGDEIRDAQFTVNLVSPDGTAAPLAVARGAEGNQVQIDPETVASPGLYRIEVTGKRGNEEIGTTEREFIVFDQDTEKANPAADPEQLARLAGQTQEFGGRTVSPDQLGELLQEILDNPPETMIEVPTRWKLGESMTDASVFLILFVGLLTVEWALRKRWGLV